MDMKDLFLTAYIPSVKGVIALMCVCDKCLDKIDGRVIRGVKGELLAELTSDGE